MSAAVDRGTIDPLGSVSQQYVANPALRRDCLPALWCVGTVPSAHITGAVEQLRCRPDLRNPARHRHARVRQRRHALRSGEQLRPATGSRGSSLRPDIARDLRPYRDELIVSSKASYDMWPGPYGQGGSHKHVLASLDHSLARLGLDYVDVFYSHRFDPHTPLEETMGALATAVRSGRAHYVGISNYDADQTRRAAAILDDVGIAPTVHQPRYNIFDGTPQRGLFQALRARPVAGAAGDCVGAAGAAGHQRLGRCVIRRATGEHPQGAGQGPSGHRNAGPRRRAGHRVIAQTLSLPVGSIERAGRAGAG
jgi:hypothetical protein